MPGRIATNDAEWWSRQVFALIRGYNFILLGMAVCSGIVISLAFVLIVVDVTIRILRFQPPAFTIAVVEYILLYYTLLAAPWLVRIKGHVFIDAVTQFLPAAVRKVTAKASYVLCICSASIFCYFSADLLIDAMVSGRVDVRGVDLPQWLLFLPLPIGFAMVAIEFFRFLIGIDDMYATELSTRESM